MPNNRPHTTPWRRALVGVAAVAALAATPSLAAPTAPLKTVPLSALSVTEGTVTPYLASSSVQTADPAMRAVVRDHGHHATRARLSFKLRGPSTTTTALGSGLIRQQIGLKLLAANPCNLVYVMWRDSPDRSIEVQVKSNPAETTSAQCGNDGYHDVAVEPLTSAPATDFSPHVLEARVRPVAGNADVLTVFADGTVAWQGTLPAALVAGLNGPAGVRSDDGSYVFRLSTGR
jgi:hypothetical protein